MTNDRWADVVETGLLLPHSKASLDYIRLKDLDLYDAIMEANKDRGQPKK